MVQSAFCQVPHVYSIWVTRLKHEFDGMLVQNWTDSSLFNISQVTGEMLTFVTPGCCIVKSNYIFLPIIYSFLSICIIMIGQPGSCLVVFGCECKMMLSSSSSDFFLFSVTLLSRKAFLYKQSHSWHPFLGWLETGLVATLDCPASCILASLHKCTEQIC